LGTASSESANKHFRCLHFGIPACLSKAAAAVEQQDNIKFLLACQCLRP
jgi:hypothetical protein